MSTTSGNERVGASIRVQCCVCRRERTALGWRFVADDPIAVYTHTYCPACYIDALAEIRASNAQTPAHIFAPAYGDCPN